MHRPPRAALAWVKNTGLAGTRALSTVKMKPRCPLAQCTMWAAGATQFSIASLEVVEEKAQKVMRMLAL